MSSRYLATMLFVACPSSAAFCRMASIVRSSTGAKSNSVSSPWSSTISASGSAVGWLPVDITLADLAREGAHGREMGPQWLAGSVTRGAAIGQLAFASCVGTAVSWV